MESSNAFSALVKRGFEWAKQQNNNTNTNDEEESNETKRDRYRSSFHDCSFPPMSTSVAKKLFRLFSDNVNSENFQLFSESLLVEEKTAQKLVSPKKEETPTDDSKIAQLKAEGALALETWKKSRGECFACTIHNNNNANIPTYKHWLFRQMPFVHVEEKEKISFENREVGARCPCPPAVELHAFRDPGDLAFLNNENVLHNPSLRDFCLEDYLRKEEGELFFQLRPVEGVAFENIESFLNSRTAVPRADKNSESCCGLSVPILYRRLPSATSIKANPLAKAHVAVQYVSLEQDRNENENNTEEERILVDAFINDLQWFVTHQVTPLQQYSNTINNNNEQKVWGQYGSPGYTLRLPDKNNNEDGYCMTAPTEVDTKQCPPCGYCGRRLVLKKLFRCSACRRSYYCCKEHQRLDWGNGHKERCAGYKLETNFLEKKVQPFLENDKNNHQKRDKAWSVAASLLAYIDHTISNDNHNAVWTLHAVFIESSSLFEKETTKHMLEQLQVLLTESDTYQHITDYLGIIIIRIIILFAFCSAVKIL
ncbi:hypothetical protein AGDE_15333 [Angomonas deanei]|uniref:MYND finger containing protein, putative n=1 Tax=Angomonas deanei TaxID=59799 RepID=A0A7G2C720_9TRYP|nr:hypothetical protein AGDE_15333 [Angomonas deanei]CAD2215610.1 MYND finger containing protein, putative [Angomonas deanei]|eukprot:EPY19272.1 hypothetical protein AGDE_15333 [Angomonas deanei]